MTTENWRDVNGYKGWYQASRLGVVRSLDRFVNVERNGGIITRKVKGIILKDSESPDGYKYVTLCRGGVLKKISVHRLIALVFLPNPHNKPCINHIDNNRANNNLKNLEWCTPQENSNHAKKQGRIFSPKGDEHFKSKIKESEIPNIRKMINDGIKVTQIAKIYKVNQPIISNIKSGKTYKHVN